MPLTIQEQAELDAINAQLEVMDQEEAGKKATTIYRKTTARPVTTTVRPSRPFSFYRAFVGAGRDALQGISDTAAQLDRYNPFGGSSRYMGAMVAFGEPVATKMEDARTAARPVLPTLAGEEDAGGVEKAVRGIGSFVVPFTAGMKVFRTLGAYGRLGEAGRGLAAGAMADFSQVDARGGNLANILRDSFGLDNAALDVLASSEDDTELEARFKAAAASAPVGLAGDAIFGAGARVAKLYRDWRGTADEAAVIVESMKKGPVKLEQLPVKFEAPAAANDNAASAGANAGAKAAPEDVTKNTLDGTGGKTFSNMEDVLSHLSDIKKDPDQFARVAENLLKGDPENALAKLGIDPAKLDFSVYDDPEMLGRLQGGLQDLYDEIGGIFGRTGQRVDNATLARSAEAWASSPEVLTDLYGSTAKLGERLMASRMFIGAHAHQMLYHANRALDELAAGGTGEAWAKFLEEFHRHALFLGMVRGAGSEVGRALQSLKALAKSTPPKAARNAAANLDEALAKEAETQAAGLTKRTIPDGASAFAQNLGTDAEKVAALQKLIGMNGDVAELTRAVREGNGSVWRRVSDAVKETMGSLFGAATATYNVGAGVTGMGLNWLARGGAALARSPGLLRKGSANVEARRAWAEVWAYGEGLLGGGREAIRNVIDVLEREGYSELSLNADALGLTKLAKRAAVKSAKAGADAGVHFERADVVNNKAFALTATETKRLREMGETLGGSKFITAGLDALSRVLAGTINAAGTGYRIGTTLFINAPDEFIGTLASRAGSYAAAVRVATREAVDMGLEGAEVSSYLKARTVQLIGDGPRAPATGAGLDAYEAVQQNTLMRAGETEARGILFQDDLEWALNKSVAKLVQSGGGPASIIIPFIKTPLRIIERTAMDYTPLGLFSARIRSALLEGGGAKDEAIARMFLGVSAVMTAYQFAEDRQIVGYDGGFRSTARDAGRPSYSFKIGDDTYEFSRLDPIGTLLGMGADIREILDAAEDDPEAAGAATEMIKAMIFATAANVLSKSWLTSIRQLTDLAGATSPEDASSRWDNFLKGLATRAIPASGIQRQLEAWGDGYLRETAGFVDGLARASLGADSLPLKRDMVGRPIQATGASRLAGVRGGVLPSAEDDPIAAEMEALSIQKPKASRTQKGVKLDAAQYSRFLELRGREVRDPNTGLTMEEALTQLFQMPEYQALPKAAKVQQVQAVMRPYSELAVEAYTKEDRKFAAKRLRKEVFDYGELQGWARPEKEAEMVRQAERLGIPVD